MDYADRVVLDHTSKRDKDFGDVKKACNFCKQCKKQLEPLRRRFNTLFEELAESKDKAEKRKKELIAAEQKCRELERQLETALANQSKFEENANSLNLPYKLDVIQGAHKPGDTLVIGGEQCTTNNAFLDVAIGTELGKGGFGTVYTATVSPQRKHAVKVYIFSLFTLTLIFLQIISKSKFAEKADNKRCVQNEVRIQMKLKHENILALQYCVEDKYNVYLLMEYCAENSLHNYLIKKPAKVRRSLTQSLIVGFMFA